MTVDRSRGRALLVRRAPLFFSALAFAALSGCADGQSASPTSSGTSGSLVSVVTVAPTPTPTATPTSTPTPTPTSTPVTTSSAKAITDASSGAAALVGVVDEGDSLSIFWGGNHTGLYAAAHSGIAYHGQAVGGSQLQNSGNDLAMRFAADAALRPAYVTVLIGANDLNEVGMAWAQFKTQQAYIDALFAYVAKWKATGARVALGTMLPQCRPGDPGGINETVNTNRAVINAAIRAAAGTKVDAVIDYAADPDIGPDGAACNTAWFSDGLHPTDGNAAGAGGQGRMALIYTKALDQLMK